MPSAISLLAIFLTIFFISGAAFGALVIFIISIHRTRRASLSEADGQQRGSISRSILATTRRDHREGAE
jgi:hypothetical protein